MTFLFSIPPLLSLVGFLSLALFVYFRGAKNITTLLFVWICALSGLLYSDILFAFNTNNQTAALWVSRMDHLFIAFLVPLYIHFFHEYLCLSSPSSLIPIAYGVASLLMCLAPTPWYIAAMESHVFGLFAKAGPLYSLFGLSWFGAAVYVSARVYAAMRKEKNLHRKKQLWFVFAGFGGLGILNGLNFFPIHGFSLYPPGNFSFIPLAVFAYGLFRHNLLNMTALINNGLVYSFLTAFLTCLYALIVTIITTVFNGKDYSRSYVFSFSFFLLIVLIFGPLKSRIQGAIDRFFFRREYDYRQTLKSVSRMIVSVLDLETVGQTLIRTLTETMQVETCRLVLIGDDGSEISRFGYPEKADPAGFREDSDRPLIRYLIEKHRPAIKGDFVGHPHEKDMSAILVDMETDSVALAVPLIFKNHVNGYFLLGSKRSGELFGRGDVDLLETLAGQSALAVENARSYKRINEINKNLEKIVAARTQSLRQALEEKERTQERLIRSESLASIGQLVAGVAHELNNPLASTVSLIQTAIEDLEQWEPGKAPDKETIDDLIFADRELRRARAIVTSLLELSRQTGTSMENVALNSVVRDAVRVLQHQYKNRTFKLIEVYGENLPKFQGDAASLVRVVLNIVQNAFQAMDGRETAVELVTTWDAETGQVVFKCLDSGPGIAAAVRKDIFKPFFTTKEPGKGTGMGLYICHEIAQRHGGELLYSDRCGGGAEFALVLPVQQGKTF
ncbi:MAG: ATP-binding protein [Pseudomonadota bacterium]